MPQWAKVIGVVGLIILAILLGILTNSGIEASALETASTAPQPFQNVVYPFYVRAENDSTTNAFMTSGGLELSSPIMTNGGMSYDYYTAGDRHITHIDGSCYLEGTLRVLLPWRFRILPDTIGQPLPFGNFVLSLVATSYDYYEFYVNYNVYNGDTYVATVTSSVDCVGNLGLDYDEFLSQFEPYYDENDPHAEYTYYCTELVYEAFVNTHQEIGFSYMSGYDTFELDYLIFDEGYSYGYTEGYHAGDTDGYVKGYQNGQTDGYEEGYTDGYEEGEEYGLGVGFTDGYHTGYSEAEGKALSNTTWLTRIADSIFSLKILRFGQGEAEVALTVGHILGVLIVVPVLVWFLKLFAGG